MDPLASEIRKSYTFCLMFRHTLFILQTIRFWKLDLFSSVQNVSSLFLKGKDFICKFNVFVTNFWQNSLNFKNFDDDSPAKLALIVVFVKQNKIIFH